MTTLPKWDYKKEYGELPQTSTTFIKVPPKTHHKGLIYYSFMTTLPKRITKKNMENFHNFFHKCSRKTFSKSIL
jgi:hypothetical protein